MLVFIDKRINHCNLLLDYYEKLLHDNINQTEKPVKRQTKHGQ